MPGFKRHNKKNRPRAFNKLFQMSESDLKLRSSQERRVSLFSSTKRSKDLGLPTKRQPLLQSIMFCAVIVFKHSYNLVVQRNKIELFLLIFRDQLSYYLLSSISIVQIVSSFHRNFKIDSDSLAPVNVLLIFPMH